MVWGPRAYSRRSIEPASASRACWRRSGGVIELGVESDPRGGRACGDTARPGNGTATGIGGLLGRAEGRTPMCVLRAGGGRTPCLFVISFSVMSRAIVPLFEGGTPWSQAKGDDDGAAARAAVADALIKTVILYSIDT